MLLNTLTVVMFCFIEEIYHLVSICVHCIWTEYYMILHFLVVDATL